MNLASNFVWVALLIPYLSFIVPVQAVLTAPSVPVVDLGYAQYQGTVVSDTVTNATHTRFLGMRYAAAPTGSRRFRAPSSPETTPGIQLANAPPSTCLQGAQGSSATTPFRVKHTKRATDVGASEDCLFLSVFMPGTPGQRKDLPVVFFIHGGGYVEGSITNLNGNDLIRESGEGVVSVFAQYRAGLFGFLPGQKVKDEGDLNAGLLDQQFALQWIQQHHIVANGGMTKPPLFRAAMTSSTFLPSQYKYNDRIPEILYDEVVNQVNCSSTVNSLDCLRAADVNALQAANIVINQSGFFGTFVFVPVVDGSFITDRPTQILRRGRVNGKIIYSITNPMEGADFVNQSIANTVQVPDYISQLFPNLESKDVQVAASLYKGLGSNIAQVISIMGETIIICPTYYLLRGFGGNAFKGEFAIPPGNHAQDVPYYFPNGHLPPFANPDFDNAFAESFADMVMSLNPNVKHDPTNITPFWPLWQESNEMVFNMTESGTPVVEIVKTSSALLARCSFWESVGSATAQ